MNESRFSEALYEAFEGSEVEDDVDVWLIKDFIPALEKRGLVITTRENFSAHKIY